MEKLLGKGSHGLKYLVRVIQNRVIMVVILI